MKISILLCLLMVTKSAFAEDSSGIFITLSSKDKTKAEFAMQMISRTLQDPRLAEHKPAARLIVMGDAFRFISKGKSPIEDSVKRISKKADFKIIACGFASSEMRRKVLAGTETLLPAVQLIDSCDAERTKLLDQKWVEVQVPENL